MLQVNCLLINKSKIFKLFKMNYPKKNMELLPFIIITFLINTYNLDGCFVYILTFLTFINVVGSIKFTKEVI